MCESSCFCKIAIKADLFRLLLPIVIILAFLVLALQPELRLAVPLLIGASAVVVIALAVILFLGSQGCLYWSPALILGVALLLRCFFVFSPPQLSDDIYRYLWDGRNLLQGVNPYAAAPAVVTPPPELADVHTRINHPAYVTIYPPMAQLVFAGGATLGGSVSGLKIFLVLIDLGLCALILVVLKRLEVPLCLATLYAWNPLPILEIAGSGHVDGAGLTLLLGAVCLLLPERENVATDSQQRQWPFLISGALLTGAGLVKLFPFVLMPALFLLVPVKRRMQFICGFFGVLAALLLPFLPHLTNMTSSLELYARNWEFAGFSFNTLRRLTGSGTAARLLLSSSFLLVVVGVLLRLIRRNREFSLLNRGRFTLAACYTIAMAMLLLTPTLQPWYALSLAVFLPFCAGPAGLVLCWAVFLTYQVQIPFYILGEWIENPLVTATVFLAPTTAWLLSRISRVRPTAVEPAQ